MFQKTTETSAKIIYAMLTGCAAAWIGWACFAHLPFLAALIVFPIAVVLAALAGAPLAAGASFLVGALVAAVITARKALSASRSDA